MSIETLFAVISLEGITITLKSSVFIVNFSLLHQQVTESSTALLSMMEQIKTCESSEVRIGHTLNETERQHVADRAWTVLQCLQQLGISCSVDEVPKIAVIGSGGGLRAMVGLLGSLSQLKEVGLLDSITYLSGVSGSTWCMASLYKESDWSTNLENVKESIMNRLIGGQVSLKERGKKLLKYYSEKNPNGNFSLTDVWAAMIVSGMVKEIDEHKLSDQRSKYTTTDPYPIYTVIDKKSKHDGLHADCWFEITPDESGYSLTGAFVDSSCWGSQFENGQKIKDQAEIDMLFLQGLCGSALADRQEIIKNIYGLLHNLSKEEGHTCQTQQEKTECEVIETLLEMNITFYSGGDCSQYCKSLESLLKGKEHNISSTLRLMTTRKFSKTQFQEKCTEVTLKICTGFFEWFKWVDRLWLAIVRSIQMVTHWIWGTTYNYVYKMEVPSIHPSILSSEKRAFVDAGLLNNSPYFSVLRQERDIDLIISLDFSEGDPFQTVVDTAKTCTELHIPFPHCVVPTGENTEPNDFYVFAGSTDTPTVIHIPLFNCINCPGEVEKWHKIYTTFQMEYTESMISDLLNKAGSNISNNKENLLREIKYIMEKKKAKLG
ncbi:cytosolic phospholipase A2 gamma-like isoform X1 [Astyanax mexicanus]|uniref:Cytosolic phospholipase A2 gamma-like isoform X1 n=1 Tax=Astyanax mexicanus TaxID=7994 RepID=A0A8T2MC68_ASTMX|nr:cytosolic phospholipase A2 gamma-like isoform X1 [Astyanax mexicanus]